MTDKLEIKQEQFILSDSPDQEEEHSSSQASIINELRKINRRLENIENLLFRKNTNATRAPLKPDILPMRTPQEVVEFNESDNDLYESVVRYLEHVGGFNLREAVNLCLKELISDDCASYFTWWGKDTGHRPQRMPLHNTKLVRAINDAVSSDTRFQAPTRTEFESNMREALRVAKQRKRNSIRRTNLANSPLRHDDEDSK